MINQQPSPYVLINIFTPAEGRMDELAAFQLAEMTDMHDQATAQGWLGNEVYRSHDDTKLIVVTRFESFEAKQAWARTERFQRHVHDLEPLLHEVTSLPVSLLRQAGDPLGLTQQRHQTRADSPGG